MSWLEDFISMLFPDTCASCGKTLYKNEQIICLFCRHHLPISNFHLYRENPLEQVFWGRIPLQFGVACYIFRKEGKVQHLIHQLKYKNRRDVGLYIGEVYGHELMDICKAHVVDAIIPVPLHPKKLAIRGYNQSEVFALGLGKALNLPIDTTTLCRSYFSETQTRKSRFKRWENVKEIFSITDVDKYRGKHVLLVDDVITTGATIESSVLELLKTPDIRISVGAIACALN